MTLIREIDPARQHHPMMTDLERANFMTIEQIKDLQTGERVLVVWSGGNGPHEYTIKRTDDGAILVCLSGLPDGYPGSLYDPLSDAKATVAIHRVRRMVTK